MGNYNLKALIEKPLLKHILLTHELCLMPLFHGTDMAVFQMTSEERAELREYCGTVIDYLLPVYEENRFADLSSEEKRNLLGNLHARILDVYAKAGYRRNNCGLYQYSNVYLTFDPDKANIYAQHAHVCGELGYVAHWLIKGAEILNYQLPSADPAQQIALEKVLKAGMCPPEPVILAFFNIPKSRLRGEKGEEINWKLHIDSFLDDFQFGAVRVLGDFDISTGTIVSLAELQKSQ